MSAQGAKVIRFPVERAGAPVEPLLTLAELQVLYGGSERWWRYRIAEGLTKHPWCGQWRFRASEVEAWMRENGRRGA